MFFRTNVEIDSAKKHYFYPMIRTLFCLLLCLITLSGSSQDKKKQKYDDYWAQEEKREQFESLKDSAHKFFQRGHLEYSLGYYKKALKLFPEDQFTKAKIQDLSLLDEDISSDIMGLLPKEKESLKMSNDDAQDGLRKLEELTVAIRVEEEDEAQEELEPIPEELEEEPPVPSTKKLESPTPELKEIRAVELKAKKGFDVTQFKEELLKEYPEGITEETVKKERSTIYRRVLVKNGDANEYLKVVHSYGSTFYFKNKKSVTQNVWLKEAF